jgi:predicted molibdopterin-dependent oxidoreductase YjgC
MWKSDVAKTLELSGTNLGRKIREDKIRAAIIFGENPSVSQEHHHFVNNLEFLVVADMFLTETAQAADVFLPLSAYMESDGHLTNWFGLQQRTNPIGSPANGLRTMDIVQRLAAAAGYTEVSHSFEEVAAELLSLIEMNETNGRARGSFPTRDGKAHFALYSDQTFSVSAEAPQILEIDARMSAQMKLIRT